MKSSNFLVMFFLIAFAAFGQQLEERVNVELVQVDVVATDSKGVPVTDLKSEDFVLKEEGKPQTIAHFYNSSNDQTRYPLTISFVVDTSYSMSERVAGLTRIDIAVRAGELVLQELRPRDQIELMEFNDSPKTIVRFTTNLEEVDSKFKTLTFQKANTAFHDAVISAIREIKTMSGRKIIVIFSDGMDSSSKTVEEDVVDAIHKSDATIIAFYSEYAALNFGPAAGRAGNPSSMNLVRVRAGEDLLREYAEISGGEFFSFHKEPELVQALEKLRAFVNSQYTLDYRPPEGKKKSGWRKIKVECKRKGIHLRYREGYWIG